MYQVQLNDFDEDDKKIMQKVKEIISIPESNLNPRDKVFINYIIYALSNGFSRSNLSLPVKKRNKDAYKFLKNYIEIISLLLKIDKKERESLYKSDRIKCGNEIVNLFSSLDLFKQKITPQIKASELKARVLNIFFKYYNYKLNILNNSLDFYFYYLSFLIQKVDCFRIILYYFLKDRFPEQLDSFAFKEYCPDLDSNNCLNLIILYIESINEYKNNYELFFIYVILVFGYKNIFHFYEDDIDVKILKKSVEDTLSIVKKKTLFNQAIGMYVYSKFRFNLKNNLNEPQESDIDDDLENSYDQLENDNENENELINTENDNNVISNNKNIKIITDDDEDEYENEIKENSNNIIESNNNEVNEVNKIIDIDINDNDENNLLNNDIIRNALNKCDNSLKNSENTDTPEKNEIIINLGDNEDEKSGNNNSNKISLKAAETQSNNIEKNNSIKWSINQNETLNEQKIEEGKKIEEEKVNLSIFQENNNNEPNMLKEHIISSNSSDGKSSSTKNESNYQSNNPEMNLEANVDVNNKDEKKFPNNQEKELTQLTDIEKINIALKDLYRKFEERDKEAKKKDKEFESIKEENNKLAVRVKFLEGDNIEMANKIKSLEGDNKIMKDDIQHLKNMLGSIQVRDLAKNFMNQFTYLLTEEDYDEIKIKKKSKWEKITEKVEISFQGYKKSPKYDSFIELFKKSENVIKYGNNEAHSIALEVYEKNIIETAKRYNLSLTDSNKIFFLIQLGVSKNSFKDGYQFLNEYFEENMTRKILKDNPLTNFFKYKKLFRKRRNISVSS